MSGPLEAPALSKSGHGPLPFAGMLLSDMGADVVRIDRPVQPPVPMAPRPMWRYSVAGDDPSSWTSSIPMDRDGPFLGRSS